MQPDVVLVLKGRIMNQLQMLMIAGLNDVGVCFWRHCSAMFVQSAILVCLLLVVDLASPVEPCRFSSRLSEHLPAGVATGRACQLRGRRVPQPVTAQYCLPLPPGDCPDLDGRIQKVMKATELLVERPVRRAGQSRQVDIRPHLKELQADGGELSFSLSCGPGGSAKPAEILALLNLDTPANRARLLRREVQYAGLDDGALNN